MHKNTSLFFSLSLSHTHIPLTTAAAAAAAIGPYAVRGMAVGYRQNELLYI